MCPKSHRCLNWWLISLKQGEYGIVEGHWQLGFIGQKEPEETGLAMCLEQTTYKAWPVYVQLSLPSETEEDSTHTLPPGVIPTLSKPSKSKNLIYLHSALDHSTCSVAQISESNLLWFFLVIFVCVNSKKPYFAKVEQFINFHLSPFKTLQLQQSDQGKELTKYSREYFVIPS